MRNGDYAPNKFQAQCDAVNLVCGAKTQEAKEESGSQSDVNKMFGDQSFVSSILSSLPGVDPNDPSVRSLLDSLQPEQEKKEDKPDKSKEK